jgi:hypothetical protein
MQRSENGRAHGYCHVLSGRSLADYCLLAGRSLAAILLMPCPRATTRGLLLAGRTKSRGQCLPHLPSFGRARFVS